MGGFYKVPADKRDLNYDKYFVDENYILNIIVEKVENKAEKLKFKLIKLLTRTEENIKESKIIHIRGTEEEAKNLFGEFVRIKNEKTRNILGSGLGLSIVKKLAQLYGGDASVVSQLDAGSTFTVVLNDA